ncbi:MAG: universal stress protein uspa-like protein [Candidatus Rokubacteria bacterium CSP1-6]|nr:MAG: universal stress protein uspa-like protein [Candidatus Rokubacteria bacterium CSP1-6]
MYKKILVPLDREAGAEVALPVAVDLAKSDGTVIRLVYVAPTPSAIVAEGRVIAYADQESDRLQHLGMDYLREAAHQLAGLPVEYAVRFGEPAEEILEEAREFGADLVVMATHGRSGVARLMLGSVAEAVLRRSEVPVVLVRHGLPAAA